MVDKDLSKIRGSVSNSIGRKLRWSDPGSPGPISEFTDLDELRDFFKNDVLSKKECFTTSEDKIIYYKDTADKMLTLKDLVLFIENIYWKGVTYQE